MRLHREKYSDVSFSGHALQQSEGDPSTSNIVLINGFEFDIKSWKSLPLGMISALQFKNDTFGTCFYSMVDTLTFVDYFQNDLENFLKTWDFYQLIFYDPIHFLSNYLALYE